MRHEMLTQRALFCHRANTKRGTLSQHFMPHVVPSLGSSWWCNVCVSDPLPKRHTTRICAGHEDLLNC